MLADEVWEFGFLDYLSKPAQGKNLATPKDIKTITARHTTVVMRCGPWAHLMERSNTRDLNLASPSWSEL